MSITGRRYLAVVRAGDPSLHRSWSEYPDRDYDVVVHYFGEQDGLFADDGDLYRARRGSKFAVLEEFFTEEPEILDGYDLVWLPDDDVLIDGPTVNALFALHRALGPGVGVTAPALTPDSYFSMGITLAVPGLALRWVNFVEVMAPMFTPRALEVCRETFALAQSNWGLDLVWPGLLEAQGLEMVVVDGLPMTHTRPVGAGTLYDGLRTGAPAEARAVCERYGVPWPYRYRTLRALGADGAPVPERDLAELLVRATPEAGRSGWHVRDYLTPTVTALLAPA